MINETFKTAHGNVPKLTQENYPVWKHKIRQVLITKKAYHITPGAQLLPLGNGAALRTLQEHWHDQAIQEIALIHIGCSNQLHPLIDDIDNPVEMWEELRDRLDNASTKLGCTQAMWKSTASPSSPDETVTKN